MKPRHWMQIAAVASAVGLAGTAIANDGAVGQNAQATNDDAARVIDQATPRPAYAPSVDRALQSNGQNDRSGNASAMSTNDVETNAAAASDLNSNASTANDLNHQSATSANAPSGTSSSGAANDVNPNASSSSTSDNTVNAAGANDSGMNNGMNEGNAKGTTQGSTMQSPKATTGLTSGLPSSANRQERLSTTNSSNFNAWASDYASQHNGRISRDEFLNEMGQRFDQLDAQHQGSLTPYEVEEIFIFSPANPSTAQSSGANGSSGSATSSQSNGGNGSSGSATPSNGGASSTTSNTSLQ